MAHSRHIPHYTTGANLSLVFESHQRSCHFYNGSDHLRHHTNSTGYQVPKKVMISNMLPPVSATRPWTCPCPERLAQLVRASIDRRSTCLSNLLRVAEESAPRAVFQGGGFRAAFLSYELWRQLVTIVSKDRTSFFWPYALSSGCAVRRKPKQSVNGDATSAQSLTS